MTPQRVAEPADEPQAALIATCHCRRRIRRLALDSARWRHDNGGVTCDPTRPAIRTPRERRPVMTDTAHTEDTVNLFAEYGEVRLSEDEFGRFVAHGHVTAEEMTAGMRAYIAEVGGAPMEKGLVPVEHVWAVIKHTDGAADDEGWYFSWGGVTQDTEGAFPLTVVPSL